MTKFIDRVGIELEGGWYQPSEDIEDLIHEDISVKLEDKDPNKSHYWGEIASPPLLPQDVDTWTRRHYPSIINSTCGMHVHVSLHKVGDYLKLADERFYDYFLDRFESWGLKTIKSQKHIFWMRLRGYNNFCRKQFRADEQFYMRHKNDTRYTHINYCWSMHKTLECRLFPMFKYPYVTISAINEYIQCIEDYLTNAPEVAIIEGEFEIEAGGDEFLCVSSL